MRIRAATLTDTERVFLTHKASIEALCAEHYEAQDIAGWIAVLSPGIYENAINEKIMIVVEKGAEILGLGILDLGHKEIAAVYIHPTVKGLGVGKKMLLELEKTASENNVDQLTLCSTINALDFYKHHGYLEKNKSFHELSNGVKLECMQMYKSLGGND